MKDSIKTLELNVKLKNQELERNIFFFQMNGKYRYVLILLSLSLPCTVEAAKLRSWLGPTSFIEGNLTVSRRFHGFESVEGEKLYVFGGEHDGILPFPYT